jgi:hypothetical protein
MPEARKPVGRAQVMPGARKPVGRVQVMPEARTAAQVTGRPGRRPSRPENGRFRPRSPLEPDPSEKPGPLGEIGATEKPGPLGEIGATEKPGE